MIQANDFSDKKSGKTNSNKEMKKFMSGIKSCP